MKGCKRVVFELFVGTIALILFIALTNDYCRKLIFSYKEKPETPPKPDIVPCVVDQFRDVVSSSQLYSSHQDLTWKYNECPNGYTWWPSIEGPNSIGPVKYVKHMHSGKYYATIRGNEFVIFTVDDIILKRPIAWIDGELGMVDNKLRVYRKSKTFGSYDCAVSLSQNNGELYVCDKPLGEKPKPKLTVSKDKLLRSVVSNDGKYKATFRPHACSVVIEGPGTYFSELTFSSRDRSCFFNMQKDNNFVVYTMPSREVMWSANTHHYGGIVDVQFTESGVLCVMREDECLQVVAM